MTEIVYTATSLWLGILTSISPCSFASNIAALSYVSKNLEKKNGVIFSGIFYTLGRCISYSILGFLITGAAWNIPPVSFFLQKYMTIIMGILFFLTGILLIFPATIFQGFFKLPDGIFKIKYGGGLAGSFLMGFILALAFCPVSAALYFGSIIPLTLRAHSGIMMPAVYGLGTGLPVLVSAAVIASGALFLEKYFIFVKKIEEKSKLITGILMLTIGVYLMIKYI